MRKISFSEATREAMAEMMEKYPECFVMGEDIARQGGIFGQFKGLPAQFPGRVIDTPISETFIVGGGVGAALAGASYQQNVRIYELEENRAKWDSDTASYSYFYNIDVKHERTRSVMMFAIYYDVAEGQYAIAYSDFVTQTSPEAPVAE